MADTGAFLDDRLTSLLISREWKRSGAGGGGAGGGRKGVGGGGQRCFILVVRLRAEDEEGVERVVGSLER